MVAVSLKNIFFKQKTAYEIYLRVTGVQTCALPILKILDIVNSMACVEKYYHKVNASEIGRASCRERV